MSFYDHYELLDLVRDDGVKTFRARQKAADRIVTIHLFSNPTAPIQAELLRKLRALPPVEAARIQDHGSHIGSLYFVTDDLADHGSLLEWLTTVTKAGAKKQESPRTAAPPISAVIEPAGQLQLNREFAELFATAERPVFSMPGAVPAHPKAVASAPIVPKKVVEPAPLPPSVQELPAALPVAKPRSMFLLVAGGALVAAIFILYFVIKMR
ncbi:MAG: hypothetical protein ABL995_02750 [Bryobacteraceae bacterium]